MDQDFDVYESEELESGDEKDRNLSISSNSILRPEDWFHGVLSRATAEQRLKSVDAVGGFLVRESDRRPKNYVLSFMHESTDILHFRITAICGSYFIGGYKFESLADLVDHFVNHSEICIGQHLSTPILPPSPVEFTYRKVIAVVSFRGLKDSDELSFLKNDIFTVFEDVGHGWLWVRSERTNDCGLIYEGLVEDLSSENLVPERLPYFFEGITSMEAVQMLSHASAGSYLVKRSDSSPGNFTLFLNTGKKIEKVLINVKNDVFEVGSRKYKCLHDITERYSRTEICDGFMLTNPLCKTRELPDSNNTLDVELYQRVQINRFSINRINADVKKRGYLHLKIKNEKKWRLMYFVLKDTDGQLLCYENEKKTKPKFVVDLCHCTFYEVHRSLFDRSYAFQIILFGMTKPSVFYFYAETEDEYREWLNFLQPLCAGYRRWHSSPFSSFRKIDAFNDETSQYRLRKVQHLNVRIHEAKFCTLKNSNEIYAVLSLNQAKIYRTNIVAAADNIIFDDDICIENVSSEISSISVSFYGRAKRLFRRSDLGSAKIDISNDRMKGDTFDYHEWVKLKSKDSETGQCRWCVKFVRLQVMPVEEYLTLYEILLANEFELCHSLASVCSDEEKHRLAVALLSVFNVDGVLDLLVAENNREVDETEEAILLFRKTSFASILMNEFIRQNAAVYVIQTLSAPFSNILECKTVLETDPSKIDKNADISSNASQLVEYARDFCKSIVSSVNIFPKSFQYVLSCLRQKVTDKWPNSAPLSLRAVSSFVFLRLICLALLHPKRYGLTTEHLFDCRQRNLLLVTKILQNAANIKGDRSSSFPVDEEIDSETVMNFLTDIRSKVTSFLKEISESCTKPAPTMQPQSSDIALHFATVFGICERNFEKIQNDVLHKVSFKNLLSVVELLRNHLNHYLRRDM